MPSLAYGWAWPIRKFRRAARRAGYPWLNYGDSCYDFRHDYKLRDFCYCTHVRRCKLSSLTA